MRKIFLFLVGMLGILCSAVSFSAEPTQAGASDEMLCAALSAGLKPSKLQPNTNEKVREVIRGIAPERMPTRLVVCSGYNPYTAAAQQIEHITGVPASGWVIAFDDRFYADAPAYVFRATMAHEVAHLLLNEACLDTKDVPQCEHQIDVYAGTLVGQCSVVRSNEWLAEYSKRRGRAKSAQNFRMSRAFFGKQNCGKP